MIKAGTRVTCEDGHYICTVAEDIVSYSRFGPDQFEDWQVPMRLYEEVPPCSCGKRWIRPPYGLQGQQQPGGLHTAEGWQSSRGPGPK